MPEAVGQAVKTRLLLWSGEWYLDLTEGTPFLQGILGKHGEASADAAIEDRIKNTQGMLNVASYESELDRDDRHLTVNTTINTIYGPTTLEVSNYGNF